MDEIDHGIVYGGAGSIDVGQLNGSDIVYRLFRFLLNRVLQVD